VLYQVPVVVLRVHHQATAAMEHLPQDLLFPLEIQLLPQEEHQEAQLAEQDLNQEMAVVVDMLLLLLAQTAVLVVQDK
jgi:hypothetical protein